MNNPPTVSAPSPSAKTVWRSRWNDPSVMAHARVILRFSEQVLVTAEFGRRRQAEFAAATP